MGIKVEDILNLKRLTSDNRIIVHNLAYNELPVETKLELLDTFDNKREEIDNILFEYYKDIFFK